jgi:flagellin-like hook-associated protein FlgL
MSLRINHNMSAVNAHRNVVNNSSAQSRTMECPDDGGTSC